MKCWHAPESIKVIIKVIFLFSLKVSSFFIFHVCACCVHISPYSGLHSRGLQWVTQLIPHCGSVFDLCNISVGGELLPLKQQVIQLLYSKNMCYVYNSAFLKERSVVQHQKAWWIFPITSGVVLSGLTEKKLPLFDNLDRYLLYSHIDLDSSWSLY